MALQNFKQPAFQHELAAGRLKLFAPNLVVWNERSTVCPSCTKVTPLLKNPACQHAFCEDCWVQTGESQLTRCQAECMLYASCLQCDVGMDERLWTYLGSQSEAIHIHHQALRSELSRFIHARQVFAQTPQLASPGPVCQFCGEHRLVLLKNTCGHSACERCWSTATEKQLLQCRRNFRTRGLCHFDACSCPMAEEIWRHVESLSPAVRNFSMENSKELQRLRANAEDAVMEAPAGMAGPTCSTCGNQHLALLRNPCGHATCEDCWKTFAEKQIPECQHSRRLRPHCFNPLCNDAMSAGIFAHICTLSAEVSIFADHVDRDVKRLQQTASEILMWASAPCQAGPICTICNERCFALLVNTECGHAACEQCWSIWVETQLPRCRDEKQPFLRCLGERCQAAVVASIWSNSCSCSDEVLGLERLFERRRSLQKNCLYPPAMQIDCPCEGCLGLGYRGFDTVMCFMCEHQWIADSGEPAATNMGELLDGELIKQCPKCGEYIMKNGGCDHMTCRCKHEFRWTTLKPWRGA